VRPVGSWVLESGNVEAQGLAVSLDKPLEWGVGFFFGIPSIRSELPLHRANPFLATSRLTGSRMALFTS